MTSTKEGKVPKTDVASKIDCADLGLSLGGDIDSPPTFDMKGKPVSGAAKTLKNDPISLAALSLLVGTRNNLRSERQNVKPAASKTKTARALEVKVEDGDDVVAFVNKLVKPDSNQQQDGVGNQENTWPSGRGSNTSGYNDVSSYSNSGYDNRGGYDGGYTGAAGRGGRGRGAERGRGRAGRTGLENYGPSDSRPIMQRKAEASCNYCGQSGHWWRECPARNVATYNQVSATPAASAVTATSAAPVNTGTPAPPQGNEPRQ
ncbi:hypothetical protein PF003_g18188 [Phytophthora fragariae]|nr:hypothetical protein PF003_g18188 [Phytophthora fragariae]